MTSSARLWTRLWLIRHGKVAADWHGRIYGRLDVPLAPEGEEHARRAAVLVRDRPLAAVVSSGLQRAEFGAQEIRRERQLPRRHEPDLAELDRGDWAGLTFEELERRDPGAWTSWWEAPALRRPPGGESLGDLDRRVVPVIERLVGEFAGQEVAIVAHSWVIRVAVSRALGLDPSRGTQLDLPTGGLVALDWPVRSGDGRSTGRDPRERPELDVASDERRPVLAGFGLDRAPTRGQGWHRGPARSVEAPR